MHFVVNHIVTELFAVRAGKLLTMLATKGSTDLTRALYHFVMFTRGENGASTMRLEGTSISSRPWPNLGIHQFLFVDVG